jgi:hypothetical protein
MNISRNEPPSWTNSENRLGVNRIFEIFVETSEAIGSILLFSMPSHFRGTKSSANKDWFADPLCSHASILQVQISQAKLADFFDGRAFGTCPPDPEMENPPLRFRRLVNDKFLSIRSIR